MKKQTKKGLRIHCDDCLFFLSALLLACFFVLEYSANLFSPPVGTAQLWKCILLFVTCFTSYLGGLLLKKRTKKDLFPYLFLLFLYLYLYFIISLTLLDKGLRLSGARLTEGNLTPREYYMTWFVNLHPLESIYTVYIRGLMEGYVSIRYVALNLLGNLCAFMPLSVLLPARFRCMRRWYCFLGAILLMVVGVEALQLWLMVGSCDVDDVILNVGGAFLLYLFLRIPPIYRFMERFWEGNL